MGYAPVSATFVLAIGGVVLAASVVDLVPAAGRPADPVISLLELDTAPKPVDPAANARAELARLEKQVAAFQAWEGRLPKQSEWPGFLKGGSENHPGAYDEDPPVNDPWGHPYVFRPDGEGGFKLMSLGSDGKPGGTAAAADILVR